jgi:hypothetical protein
MEMEECKPYLAQHIELHARCHLVHPPCTALYTASGLELLFVRCTPPERRVLILLTERYCSSVDQRPYSRRFGMSAVHKKVEGKRGGGAGRGKTTPGKRTPLALPLVVTRATL